MKRILLFLISIFAFLTASAQSAEQKALAADYLSKYAAYAVEEMQRSGVPASITLAQGMLESSYGRSELAVKANNHFGIQSHGNAWKGKTYSYVDSGELREFRKYSSVLHSYEDHSDFLVTHKRYAGLFELESTDYKGWARGLKSAGYAEDPAYAEKLIRVIEMYDLCRYDVPAAPVVVAAVEQDKKKHEDRKVKVEKSSEHKGKTSRYTLSRETYSQNGVPFVYAYEGETYADIARQHGLFLKEVLSYNDAAVDGKLERGSVVYLQAKKRKAAKGNDKYIVEEGMGMPEISQKFAVKLKKLYKMNEVEEGYVPNVGDVIILR